MPLDLVDLILLACTSTDPVACREYHLMQSYNSLQECTMQAQPVMAQWSESHPAYHIVRWRCAWPDQEDRKI